MVEDSLGDSFLINLDDQFATFPHPSTAFDEPDGLLCLGGDLSISRLVSAYQNGIFPWFNEGEPIMWWSPSQRAIIPTQQIHISKNMKKLLKQNRYAITFDHSFEAVINHCSRRYNTDEGVWINSEMISAYCNLHRLHYAHSVEVWDADANLVGGLYGIFVKNIFCGESMFSLVPNASKVALIKLAEFLVKNQCDYIDCQLETAHLLTMGAQMITRDSLLEMLQNMQYNQSITNISWS